MGQSGTVLEDRVQARLRHLRLVSKGIFAHPDQKEYNPDQPRDDDGRFASGDDSPPPAVETTINSESEDPRNRSTAYYMDPETADRINGWLRSGGATELQPGDRGIISNMTSLLQDSSLKEDTTLYRGLPASVASVLSPGNQFVDKGFVSTSSSEEMAGGLYAQTVDDYVMRIDAPAGTPAFSTTPSGNPEGEVILGRDLQFTVTAVDPDAMTIRATIQSSKSFSTKDWDEDAHPRQPNGEFGEGGGGAAVAIKPRGEQLKDLQAAGKLVNNKWGPGESFYTPEHDALFNKGPDQTAIDYIAGKTAEFQKAGGQAVGPLTGNQLQKAYADVSEINDTIRPTTAKEEDGVSYTLNALNGGLDGDQCWLAKDADGNCIGAINGQLSSVAGFAGPEKLMIGYLGSTGEIPGTGSALMEPVIDYCHDNRIALQSIASPDSTVFHLNIGRNLTGSGGSSSWSLNDIDYLWSGLHAGGKSYNPDQPREANGEWGEGGSNLRVAGADREAVQQVNASRIYRAEGLAAVRTDDGHGRQFNSTQEAATYANLILQHYGGENANGQIIKVQTRNDMDQTFGPGTTGATFPPSEGREWVVDGQAVASFPPVPEFTLFFPPGPIDQDTLCHETAHCIGALTNSGGGTPTLDDMGHGTSFNDAFQKVLDGEMPDYAQQYRMALVRAGGVAGKAAQRVRAAIVYNGKVLQVCSD